MSASFPLRTVALALTLGLSATAQADVITQWNFNSTTPDSSTGTGTTLPSIGAGTASLVGGVTSSFASGASNGGSSDTAAADNSGWQTTGYAAQGTGDKSRGVQFAVSTLGFESITLSYDLRHSNTSARHELVQYSLDGLNFVDFTTFSGAAGDTWFKNRTVDLSGIAGVADNASFAFRVVATFAPGTSQYLPSQSSSNYGGNGTWRFDMVTVSGAPVTPVPEPETYALLAAGLMIVWVVSRRRLG
jgi:hypothetical protein